MKNIEAHEAKKMLLDSNTLLIDVREHIEHHFEKVNMSVCIPVDEISSAKLQEDKSIIIMCGSGMRSLAACQKLIEKGFGDRIYNLEGGLKAWKAAGLPTEKSTNSHLPLDRQVQLGISIMILSGLTINSLISPWGLALPAIAGLGLMNAALTGWCGLAMLMAKMPWNRYSKET